MAETPPLGSSHPDITLTYIEVPYVAYGIYKLEVSFIFHILLKALVKVNRTRAYS
jgi:hypothetical protein